MTRNSSTGSIRTPGHLAVQPWIRPAVAAAVTAYDRLGPTSLTHGLLHCDPAPEAFRLDQTSGACGLIDCPPR